MRCAALAPAPIAAAALVLAAATLAKHHLRRRRRQPVSWPALNRMHSVNVALAKHARAHFARRCILQSGLAIATCEELLESSTCAALRTMCYPADVSQRVTPHIR